MVKNKIGIQIRPQWNMQIIKPFLKIALPFAITAIFVKMYTYTDRFMLLKIAGQGAVGWYVTAHKLTYALEFIPSAFSASIFPAMSAFYISSKEKLSKTFETAMKYLMILAIPISVGAIILADTLILKVYGHAYETSIIPLRILIAGLLVVFCNFPVGALLNACNKQVVNTVNMGITVAVNIVLNVYFIVMKGYSFKGAAVAALVSGILLFILGLRWVGKIAPYNKRSLLMVFIKTALASAIMGAALLYLKNSVQVFALMLLGVVLYIIALFLVKGFTKQDVLMLYRAVVKKSV
jgi:O-antigen/teichoic acid export membrane protein